MSDEEIQEMETLLESLFSYINWVEDTISEIENPELYEYVVSCLQSNDYCTIEGYKEFLGDDKGDE